MDRIAPIALLKLRLALRQSRGAMQVIGLIMLLFFFIIPLAAGGGAASFVAFRELDGRGDRELLHLMLGGVWLFWLVFPIVGFSLNQSYDLTRLFIYPLRRITIFAANVLACFLDPTLLIVAPMFVVVAYYYSTSLAAVIITLVALLLFLAHTIALSQAVLWALLNLLRSRRVRDWAILLAPLLGLAIYLMPHLLVRSAGDMDLFQRLVGWGPSQYLRFSPIGMAAGAIEMGARARWWQALGFLAGSVASVGAALALGAFVLARLHSGELGASSAPTKEAAAAELPVLQRLATTPLAALAIKEARYYWRDPRCKSTFIAPLFPLVFVVGSSLLRHGPGFSPSQAVGFTAAFVLLGFSSLFQNAFGLDREGLRLLFVTPCRREDILLGKNIAPVVVVWLTTSAVTLVAGLIVGDPYLAGVYVPFILAVAILFAAMGNIMSIYFPVRMARRGENPFASSPGRGCLSAFISSMGFLLTLVVAAAPVVAAATVPLLLGASLVYLVAVPMAVLYAVGVYVALLRGYTANALARREMDILEECLTGEPG